MASMDAEENPYRILDRTRRAEVNWGTTVATNHLNGFVQHAIEASKILVKCDFDARDVSREESIGYLEKTIALAKVTKDRYLRVRRELDNLIFNLDWFIRRCDQDLKRFRG